MGDFLNTAQTAVAVAASSLAALVAVGQITLAARLRKTEAWATAAANSEENPSRKAVLERIRLRATARLVGSDYLPAHYFIEVSMWVVAAPTLILLSLLRGTPTPEGVASTAFTAFMALALAVRRGIRLYLERQRVIRQYFEGERKVGAPRTDLLAQMEGGTRAEFGYAALFTLGVCLTTLAVGWFVSTRPEDPLGPLVVLIVGLSLMNLTVVWLRKAGLPIAEEQPQAPTP